MNVQNINLPTLSVVVPSYNSEKFIEECLQSIDREAQDGVEFILVDGASTDRTMEIVGRYGHLFSHVISEPDQGQSDAFNKGFRIAKGYYITWLNSDDVLCEGSLKRIIDVIKQRKSNWYVANSVYIDSDSNIMRCCKSGKFERFALKFGILNVFGPSTIVSKELFIKAGKFREDFHFCMDTEYWWRLVKLKYEYQRIPIYLWALRLHDAAKTASAITGEFAKRPLRMQEEGTILRKLYYPDQTYLKLRFGVFLARLYRFLMGYYILAIIDTSKSKGKPVSALSLHN